mgnify:CR=1 FL=1
MIDTAKPEVSYFFFFDVPCTVMFSNVSASDFSSLPKFILLKENMNLSSPELAAEKILYLIENADKFEGVIQDVREF